MVGYVPFFFVDFDIKPTVVNPSTTVGYVPSVMTRLGFYQCGFLIFITDRILMNTVGFLDFISSERSVIFECGRFSGNSMVIIGRF